MIKSDQGRPINTINPKNHGICAVQALTLSPILWPYWYTNLIFNGGKLWRKQQWRLFFWQAVSPLAHVQAIQLGFQNGRKSAPSNALTTTRANKVLLLPNAAVMAGGVKNEFNIAGPSLPPCQLIGGKSVFSDKFNVKWIDWFALMDTFSFWGGWWVYIFGKAFRYKLIHGNICGADVIHPSIFNNSRCWSHCFHGI